jgi:hypothetical protein
VADVAQLVTASSPVEITQRLRALDREWDIERVLETNAAALPLIGQLLSTRSHWWRAVTVIVLASCSSTRSRAGAHRSRSSAGSASVPGDRSTPSAPR